MTMVERLLWLADELSRQSREVKSAAVERRAVSTAYYAVFHAITALCASELLGSSGALKKTAEFERVYRALDHKSLKSAFSAAPLNNNQTFKAIGNRVVELQSERIRSDYLPSGRLYKKSECDRLVRSARSIVAALKNLSSQDRRTLAVYLIFKNRPQ
ncbi:MAG: HEPN domain-containing protein [Methylocystis sp.]|nr:HEPN domain-containing protein [Methylocystis sp.]